MEKIMYFKENPIVKENDGNIIKIKNNRQGDLIVSLNNATEQTLISFFDNGTADEIIYVCAYRKFEKDLYELYTMTFIYDENGNLKEDGLVKNDIGYLQIVGNFVKLFNNLNEAREFNSSLILK